MAEKTFSHLRTIKRLGLGGIKRTGVAGVMATGLTIMVSSCSTTREAAKPTGSVTKEEWYRQGHQLYLARQLDSADATLRQASSIDSLYAAPLSDLASLNYELGMQVPEKSPLRVERFRTARSCFARVEALGIDDAEVYERLCELSVVLGDGRGFLKYARKNAERYPYDRQYYNLGLAYFGAEEYQNVIKTQKEATEKFKESPYVGAFYRQLGRAYMKIGRDQTAERVFDAGLLAVDRRIAELKKSGGDDKSGEPYRRLMDDKVGMLVSLRWLHQTYRATEKLERVERELKEAGYTK
jgi:tetratricopeptide (TPR) repeat protein